MKRGVLFLLILVVNATCQKWEMSFFDQLDWKNLIIPTYYPHLVSSNELTGEKIVSSPNEKATDPGISPPLAEDNSINKKISSEETIKELGLKQEIQDLKKEIEKAVDAGLITPTKGIQNNDSSSTIIAPQLEAKKTTVDETVTRYQTSTVLTSVTSTITESFLSVVVNSVTETMTSRTTIVKPVIIKRKKNGLKCFKSITLEEMIDWKPSVTMQMIKKDGYLIEKPVAVSTVLKYKTATVVRNIADLSNPTIISI